MIFPKKILAMKLRAMGDTVLMTAALDELRKAYPHAQIDVAVTGAWAPLIESHSGVSKVWKYERHVDRASRAKAVARLAFRLRKERYDLVINFHASPSSARISFATGARTRSIHFHGHKDKNRYSTVVVPGKGVLKPIIERDMDAVRALGIQVPEGRLPRIHLTPTEKSNAASWLQKLGLSKQLMMIGLGASRPSKLWPIERFAELAVGWARSRGGAVLAIAGPAEKDEIYRFLKAVDDQLMTQISNAQERADLRSLISAENQLSLRQLASLLGQASVYAGNDSGPKHIAIAVGTPTVTVFGPEHPFEWHPYPQDKNPYLFVENLPCRKDADPGMPAWCGIHDCVVEQHRCMTMIGTDQVMAECVRVARDPSAGSMK